MRKEKVIKPELDMNVFHERIYNGREMMKIVGIRKDQVELEGDYSGGTHNVCQKEWMSLEGTIRYRKICSEHAKPTGCQLPNVHCGYPQCEPYIESVLEVQQKLDSKP